MMRRNISDTVLLSGWLFADLFLGLAVIFLAALSGTQPLVQILTSETKEMGPKSQQCTGVSNKYQCTVTIQTRMESRGDAHWKVSTDMSDPEKSPVRFSPASGTLAPNGSQQVTISEIPCHDGSFTFLGGTTTTPVTILWKCAPPAQRLDLTSQTFRLTVDTNGLLNNSQGAVDDVKRQVRGLSLLKGRSVGLAIVATGAPDNASIPRAQRVSEKIYEIFGQVGEPFQRASYYAPLYKLNDRADIVYVDVFLYMIQENT